MSSLASLPESDIDDDDSRRSLPSVSESVAHSVGSTAAHSPLLDEAAAAARAAIALDRGHDYSGALAMYRLVVSSLRRADVSEGSRVHSAVAQRLPGYERRVKELERHMSNRSGARSTNHLFNSSGSSGGTGASSSRHGAPPAAERSPSSYSNVEASEPTSSPRRAHSKNAATVPPPKVESSSSRPLLLPPPSSSPRQKGGSGNRGVANDVSRFLGRDYAARSSGGGSSSGSGVYGMLTTRGHRRSGVENSRYDKYNNYNGSRSGARNSSNFGLSSLVAGKRNRGSSGGGRRWLGSRSGRRMVMIASAAVGVGSIALSVRGGGSRHAHAQAPNHWPHRYKTYGFEPPASARPWEGYGGGSIYGGGVAAGRSSSRSSSSSGYEDSYSSGNGGFSGNGRETVVLIPGLDSSPVYFSDLVPELTASGLRVVVFFLPLATPSGHAFPHPPLPSPTSAASSGSNSRSSSTGSSTEKEATKKTFAAVAADAPGSNSASSSSNKLMNLSAWSSALPSLFGLETSSDVWSWSWWKSSDSGEEMATDTVYDLDYISAELQRVLLELQLVKPGSSSSSSSSSNNGVHVVGESFGGVVATNLARRHPSSVKSLVLVSSACRAALSPRIFLEAALLLPIAKVLGRLASPWFAQHLFAMVYARDVVASSEAPWVKDLFTKESGWAHHSSMVARATLALHLNECPAVGASLTKTPVLIVFGASDYDSMALSLELFAAIHSGGNADAATAAAAAAASAATAAASSSSTNGQLTSSSSQGYSRYGNSNSGNGNGGSLTGTNPFSSSSSNGRSATSKVSLLALPGGRWPHLTSPKRLAAAIVEMARKYK